MSGTPKPSAINKDEMAALGELKPRLRGARASSVVTHFMAHGALQAFTQDETVATKHAALARAHKAVMHSGSGVSAGVQGVLQKMQTMAKSYFQKLDPSFEYDILSPLMSYLTMPVKGIMYSTAYQPSDLPASITFMGQFIDHDLTKNATNLVDPENDPKVPIENFASPYIDLDSVYGPRMDDTTGGGLISPRHSDGRFVLTKLDVSNNAYDVQREDGEAQIDDGRNDENQLVLQVHLLIMRVNNLLIKEKGLSRKAAQKETIFNWQSVVLNDHQASVLDPAILAEVLHDLQQEVAHPGHGHVKYRPVNGVLQMPHEFAIGFRYGHSQLRNAYYLGPGREVVLFNNLDPGPHFKDLRGGRALAPGHVIDWPYFIVPADADRKSNKLDTLVASDVFDLPESAVPDVPTKFLGNLPQRNLIRSREIGVTSGEKLFDFYFGEHAPGKLEPHDIEPDKEKRKLFELQKGAGFQTPLWVYILKEAELAGGSHLGKLGSRLVGEVVGGAIYYNPVAYVHEPHWKSAINGSRVVMMKDLVDFVQDKDAA